MKKHNHIKLLAAGLIATSMLMAGCSKSDDSAQKTASTDAATQSQPKAHGTIKLAYVEWASCLASTNVAAAVLEDAGYKVKTISVTAAMLYEGLANGDVDGMVCAWLPTTHKAYYAKTKDRLVNLGPNMKGTKIGLVVPSYVKIDSIEQLKDPAVAKKFDGRIVGIDPGAGIMSATEQAIKDYKLPEKLIVGSGATMTAVLGDSIRQNKPVVVTGWTPHWMWARWDLKYLNDPKLSFGKPENIDTLVRKGLKTDKPIAYQILNNFEWTGDDMGQVMAADRKDGADPMTDAKNWIKAHQKIVDDWTATSSK